MVSFLYRSTVSLVLMECAFMSFALKDLQTSNGAEAHPLEDICMFILNSTDANATELGSEYSDKIKYLKIVNCTIENHTLSYLLDLQHVEVLEAENVGNFSLETLRNAQFLTSIKELRLTGMSLGDLKESGKIFQNMTSLVSLKMPKTNLSGIDLGIFSENKMLTDLDLSGNNIHNLSFPTDFLNRLNFLRVSGCNLTSIKVEPGEDGNTANLQTADLSNNLLKYLPESFCNVLHPNAHINLTDNSWDTESCRFYPLWKILFKNGNAKIGFAEQKPGLLSCGWDTCPASCTCLRDRKLVDCSDKGLTSIPDVGPSDAEVLVLSKNSVEKDLSRWLQIVVSWCNLKTIYLDSNNITHIFNNEREVYGSCQCPDKKAPNCILPHLTTLSLSGNKIAGFSEFDWKFIRNLEEVDLSRNKIESVSLNNGAPLGDFSIIKFLNLSHNMKTCFIIGDAILFPYLETLDLSHNHLNEFDFGIGSLVPKLEMLDLSFNNMSKFIVPQAKEGLDIYSTFVPHLETLFLHENELQDMISPMWRSLRNLVIHGNAWKCTDNNIKAVQNIMWMNPRANVAKTVLNWICYDAAVKVCDQPPFYNELSLKIVIICTLFFFGVLIFFAAPIQRSLIYIYKYMFKKHHSGLGEREFDVFIIYASDAAEYVEKEIVPRLIELEYKVACSDRDCPIGEYKLFWLIEMTRKSRRMLAVLTKEFVNDDQLISDLKQGLIEEKLVPEFKVGALLKEPYVMDTDCPEEVYLLAFLRKPIKSGDLNCFEKIKRFLGQPNEEVQGNSEEAEGFQQQQADNPNGCQPPEFEMNYVNGAYQVEEETD